MTIEEYLPLWQKIRDFPIDDPSATTPFSVKLATEQHWSSTFTLRAIEEYRKFIFLCCISAKGASPSKIVDEVWHLHLTYTRSYWKDFCRDTLGKDIHHHPSAGGDAEDHKHQGWYNDTLELYTMAFGSLPPLDIWPAPITRPSSRGEIEEPAPLKSGAQYLITGLVLLPFLFIWAAYGTISPFTLGGRHFLCMASIAPCRLRWWTFSKGT